MQYLAVLILSLGVSGAAAPGVPETLPEAGEKTVQKGLDDIFLTNFAEADREFREFLEEYAGHPFGYFGLAGSAWTNLIYGSYIADPALEKEFFKRTDDSIRKAQAWLKTHPKDASAMIVLGGAYGLRSRTMIHQKKWLRAVMDGRRALKAMQAGRKLDPEFYDAYLGIGTWEYYADVFPRFVKVLGKLFLGGDRKLGLQHMQLAAEKARYIGVTAKLMLIEIYIRDRFGARDPRKALEMIRQLRRRQPQSPLFHQIEQVVLFAAEDFDGVLKVSEEYLKYIQAKRPNYSETHIPRVHIAVGTVGMARGDLRGAKEAFARCLPLAGEKERPNWWGVWGVVRLAQVEDALGERQEALKHYRLVMQYRDVWGFRDIAKGYLSRPFKPGQIPLEFPPP